MQDPAVVLALGNYQYVASELIKANSALYSRLAHSTTLSLEYSLDRQPMVQAMASGSMSPATETTALMNTPDLHTVCLIHFRGATGQIPIDQLASDRSYVERLHVAQIIGGVLTGSSIVSLHRERNCGGLLNGS